MKRTKQPSEHQIQSAYFEWVRLTYPGCKLIYAVPNGGKRHIVTAKKMKAEGVTPGIPDINIDIPRTNYCGARIETKSAKGKTSPDQDEAIRQLRAEGYLVAVCHSTEAMIDVTRSYLRAGNGSPHKRFKTV